ncbi:MAG: hypothetical protein IKW04_02075 [Clostridia bacterium]|nr:hypothetical protein [Clostridia bacterium]
MNKFKEILKQNTAMKIFSVILAVLLWAFVQLSENPEISYKVLEIPVKFNGEAALNNMGLEMIDRPEDWIVKVYISTDPSYVNAVTESSVSVTADISNFNTTGTHEVAVKAHSDDQHITIINQDKYVIPVTIDDTTIVEKTSTVLLDKRNDIYYLDIDHVTISPSKAKVRLPSSLANSVNKVAVVLNLENVTSDSNIDGWYEAIPVDSENLIVENDSISIQDNRFHVQVPVLRKISVPLEMQNLSPEIAENYTLSHPMVTIAVHPEDIHKIKKVYGTIQGSETSSETYAVNIHSDVDCEFVLISQQIELKQNDSEQ